MKKITVEITGIKKEALKELVDYLTLDKCALAHSPKDLGYKHLQEGDIDVLGEAILEGIERS